MQNLYHYTVSQKCIPNIFDMMVRDSLSLELIISAPLGKKVTLIYDDECDVLHMNYLEGIDVPFFHDPPSPSKLKEFLSVSNMTLKIITRKNYFESGSLSENQMPYTIQKIKDYPQMITDLENNGTVITSESKSFLATDPRMFRFSKEPIIFGKDLRDLDPDGTTLTQEWHVDCLGTSLCKDITKLVEQAWLILKTKSGEY